MGASSFATLLAAKKVHIVERLSGKVEDFCSVAEKGFACKRLSNEPETEEASHQPDMSNEASHQPDMSNGSSSIMLF